MILQEQVAIDAHENAGSLHDKLMTIGSKLVLKTVKLIEKDAATTTPQKEIEGIQTAYKINKDTCKIDWNDSLINIHNKIRGLSPYPTAWCTLYNNKEELSVKIYEVEKERGAHNYEVGSIIQTKIEAKVAVTGGYINLKTIQLPGKRKMDITSLLNGYQFEKSAKMS